MWILTPTCSNEILQQFKAEIPKNQPQGVYFLAEGINFVRIISKRENMNIIFDQYFPKLNYVVKPKSI